MLNYHIEVEVEIPLGDRIFSSNYNKYGFWAFSLVLIP
jgi:hypothetical protein